MSLVFDTLAYANKLKKAGVPAEQAEAQSEAFAEAVTVMVDNTLATKDDIRGVKLELQELKKDLCIEMKELENKLTLRLGTMIAASMAILSTLLVILHIH